MDDMLREFLTETNESLDVVDVELVKFEREPNNVRMLDNIFRLVHTIKGTCGFLGLPRLGSLAHAAETLMGKFRDGALVTSEAVGLILQTIDRIKEILAELEANAGNEPAGSDDDLISQLDAMSAGKAIPRPAPAPEPEPVALEPEPPLVVPQQLERELKPGEVSLEELERIFQATESEVPRPSARKSAEPAPVPAPAPTPAPAPAPVAAAEQPPAASRASAEEARAADGKGAVSSQSIRVNVETLEHLMTQVSELVLTRNQLLEMVRRHEDSEFKVPLQRLSNVTAELQEGVMKTRMQPIGNAWQKLPRVVRDLAQDLGKKIELEMVGADTELDRQVLDLIKDPLMHMIRNSADHGLETTEERRRVGKPETGTIRLSAYHEGGHIILEIADDGKGLDVARIRNKALERGLATEAELDKMSDAQIQKFIFHAGFSTAAQVTSVSGRGVGMDVVRNNIELIGGMIDVRSKPGISTTFVIKIPLTLAIVSALIVEAAGNRFAIPQLAVVELVRVRATSEHRVERINNTRVLRLRDKLLPVAHLGGLLGTAPEGESERDDGFIVVMLVGNQTFGIEVDAVFHTEEIVVKPMSSMLRHLSMFSGNTILGDGSVIMIIDPNGVAQAASNSSGGAALESGDKDGPQSTEALVSLLLFRAGTSELKAVPLSLVTRLEEFEVDKIERSQGMDLVQYRGSLMPLVYFDDSEGRREAGKQPVLVFSEAGRTMGLVVDEIVDIVEDRLEIELGSDRPTTVGSAIVKGRATEVVDISHFIARAFKGGFGRRETQAAAPRHLLFVDDSSFFRNMLRPVLESAGYVVRVCSSAAEALRCLGEGERFDVIVSDIEMPEMDGFEFAATLRADPSLRDVPIVALSGLCTPEAIERGHQTGFTDYIAKFDKPGLIAVLKEFAGTTQGVAA